MGRCNNCKALGYVNLKGEITEFYAIACKEKNDSSILEEAVGKCNFSAAFQQIWKKYHQI